MKKLARAAALPVLAALLSACATPTNPNAVSENTVSEQAVQKAVVAALALKDPDGLNPVQKEMVAALALTDPDKLNPVQKALLKTMGKIKGGEWRKLTYEFRNMQGTTRKGILTDLKSNVFNEEKIFEHAGPGARFKFEKDDDDELIVIVESPWGFNEDTVDELKAEIDMWAAGKDSALIPVSFTKTPSSRRPAELREEKWVYKSVGADPEPDPKPSGECEVEYHISATGRQITHETAIWYQKITDKKPLLLERGGSTKKEKVRGTYRQADGVCEVNETHTWRVMAVNDSNSPPWAAEYHEITVEIFGDQSPQKTRKTYPLRITEDLPLCPPEAWEKGGSRKEFMDKLEEDVITRNPPCVRG